MDEQNKQNILAAQKALQSVLDDDGGSYSAQPENEAEAPHRCRECGCEDPLGESEAE